MSAREIAWAAEPPTGNPPRRQAAPGPAGAATRTAAPATPHPGGTHGPSHRVRARGARHPGLLGRHPGALLVGLALTLLTIATVHVVALGARSAGAMLALYFAGIAGWVVIDR